MNEFTRKEADNAMTQKSKFRLYCEEHGYKAQDVADALGISLHTVHAYMRGARFPSRKILKLMNEKLEGFNNEIFL